MSDNEYPDKNGDEKYPGGTGYLFFSEHFQGTVSWQTLPEKNSIAIMGCSLMRLQSAGTCYKISDSPVKPSKKCNQGAVEKIRAGGGGVMEIFFRRSISEFFVQKQRGVLLRNVSEMIPVDPQSDYRSLKWWTGNVMSRASRQVQSTYRPTAYSITGSTALSRLRLGKR